MQTNDPQDPIDRLSLIVDRFIDATQQRFDQTDNRTNQLEQAQLASMAQIGLLADLMRQNSERSNLIADRTDARLDRIAENIERLEMLVDNLIRRPPTN